MKLLILSAVLLSLSVAQAMTLEEYYKAHTDREVVDYSLLPDYYQFDYEDKQAEEDKEKQDVCED